MTGIELIAQERQEQIEKHGYTVEADSKKEYLLQFAHYLLLDNSDAEKDNYREILEEDYEFDPAFLDKLERKSRIDSLVICAAVIAAEIDRIIYDDGQDEG